MKNITHTLGTLYPPVKAFVVYKRDSYDNGMPSNNSIYIESYDMDSKGYTEIEKALHSAGLLCWISVHNSILTILFVGN
jgi:hypothetical protein